MTIEELRLFIMQSLTEADPNIVIHVLFANSGLLIVTFPNGKRMEIELRETES